jgi:Clr5 domain
MDSTYSSLGDEKLELYKEEIYRVYMKENKTLQTTISMMEEKHGFIAR